MIFFKKLIIIILLILPISLQAEHAIRFINNSNQKVSLLVVSSSYFNFYSNLEKKIDKDSVHLFSFKRNNPNSNYNIIVEYEGDTNHDKSHFQEYYSFLDDTLEVNIENDTVIYNSINGYNKALEYQPDLQTNVIDYSVSYIDYIKLEEEKLDNKINEIKKIKFKSKKMEEFCIQDARFLFQRKILKYLLDYPNQDEKLSLQELSAIYEESADYDIINSPIYYNTINYKILMSDFLRYRESLVDEVSFKLFRKNKLKEILDNKLSSFARQVMEVKQLYYYFNHAMDKHYKPNTVKKKFKEILDNGKYHSQINEDIKQMIKLEFSLAEGNKFPVSELVGIDGKKIYIDDYYGNVVVLCFYSFYCGGCTERIPTLLKIKDEMKDKKVKFMFINCDDELSTMKKAIQEYGLANDINLWVAGGGTGRGKYGKELGVNGVPYVIIVDPKGNNFEHYSCFDRAKAFKMKLNSALLINKIEGLKAD